MHRYYSVREEGYFEWRIREKKLKEGVLACFNAVQYVFNGGTEVNIEINFRIIGVRIENHTGNLQNMKQDC